MISNPVVLVLGAGASSPYGFPVGDRLVHEALFPPAAVSGPLERELDRRGFTKKDVASFRTALEASLTSSIDAFLETRQQFEELGRLIIAYLLMGHEDPTTLFRLERDPSQVETWYGTLFGLMHTPDWNDFGQNQLSVITYNYDRSFEYCLLRVLEATYGLEWNECIKILEQHIPIIHLHGTLGELYGRGKDIREYRTDLSTENLDMAVRNIRIVHEIGPGGTQFLKAYEKLEGAKHVVFLGFGYYWKNVQRLRLDGNCPKATLWGTCKGFTEGEQERSITPQIPRLKGRHLRDDSVIELLRYKPAEIFGPAYRQE